MVAQTLGGGLVQHYLPDHLKVSVPEGEDIFFLMCRFFWCVGCAQNLLKVLLNL